jgi:sodium-dependent phosphate cotransporter
MADEQPIEPVADDEEVKDTRPSRKDRPTGSVHFGDSDFDVEDDYGDATWGEVCTACCCHTPVEWAWLAFGICCVATLLYFFLFGLDLLGNGAKVMSGCKAGELFGDDTNPIAGLMIGILATVLLQSSSTTTSIIVSLVGGDDATISVKQGIYMVMGANIGTSVTNTIVAMGQMGDGDQLERAFSGATVHDMFNFMTVAILLPLEVVTQFLYHLTKAMVKNADTKDGEKWEGPIKKIVSPLGKRVIIANKKVTKAVANGEKECEDFYPMNCEGEPTYKSCDGKFGLIACDKDHNFCPAFFAADADAKDDKVSGGVVFFIAIMILFTCLLGIVAILQKMLMGMSTRIIYKATDVNGYVAIAIGAGITMLVQSSSITTSTLTPFVGMGALRLEQMFPLTLGANIGTTLTGITAAMVADTIDSLQVALAHLFFNITGIAIFYPIPFMRKLPLYAARRLGRATRVWRGFPLVYIFVMFVVVPLFFLGLSAMFEKDTKGFKVLGSFIVILISIGLAYMTYWCLYMDGREKCVACMTKRERKRVAIQDLPDDMEFLKARVAALSDHTGLQFEEDEEGKEGTKAEEDEEVEA